MMPPKKKFSKEQVVDAAFEIARLEGIDNITIRKVADQLGSSIAPIYVEFDTVDELLQEVIKKTFAISKRLLEEQNTGNPFLDIGVASLRFAKEYPVLFKNLIDKNNYRNGYDEFIDRDLVNQMKNDPELEGFSNEELLDILLKMRIFQTGLSVMVANGLLHEDLTDEKLINLLERTASDIIIATRLGKDGARDEEKQKS